MLPLQLNPNSGLGRSAQIAAGLRDLVLQGILQPGESVPSSRTLAAQLGVARGTVVAAYDQLTGESYLTSSPGAPTRVHPHGGGLRQRVPAGSRPHPAPSAAVETANSSATGHALPINVDLRPQHRRNFTLDDPMWRAAWRRAATQSQPSSPQVPREHGGNIQLRRAIAEHLRLTRSLLVNPAQIFVTAGAREGLDLVLAALGQKVEPLAVEQPGYRGLQKLLIRRGIVLQQVAADQYGIRPSLLQQGTRGVLVTPNHLYPRGGSMPAPRRLELLHRAQDLGALVIEDDYDSEFRHLDAPIPTLWELSPEQVIHLGTFHQVLSPEAHIGYLIVPTWLDAQLRAARADLGGGASPITQRAVADYLQSGGLRRHLARRRRELLRRRRMVTEMLTGHVVETSSGSSAVIILPTEEQAKDLVTACAQAGIALSLVSDYWQHELVQPGVSGCVLNYADSPIEQLASALGKIVELTTLPNQVG